jgi:hypothetical protein
MKQCPVENPNIFPTAVWERIPDKQSGQQWGTNKAPRPWKHMETSSLAAGQVCPSHCRRAGTHPLCSVVGGCGCLKGPGHGPDFKAFSWGILVPSTLS